MKTLTPIYTIILLISCSSGDGLNKKVYYPIDESIIKEVAANTRKDGKMEIGSLEIRYYEDDSLITETFSNDKSVSFWIIQKHSPDHIQLTGMVGMFDASGFRLGITKEKFNVDYFTNADFGIYKKKKSDTVLSSGVTLQCKDESLTLSAYPGFEDGEDIIGIVEFKTPEYWQVSNGKEKKIRLEGKAYLSTRLIKKENP